MINRLIEFLNDSPVNFLAVASIAKRLDAAGYKKFNATDKMPEVKAGDKFYVTKNDSSIYAFEIGKNPLADAGFHLICAHCDSPTFRIKPNAEMLCEGGVVKLNTELYGGAIMSTWFDRPLSLAGRVITRSCDALHPDARIVHIKRPLLQIPNLAIHFNRQVNDGVALSKQKDMLPVLGIVNSALESNNLLVNIIEKEAGINAKDIIDFDLYLYDTTPACLFGLNNEFISAGRLDDLSMVHAGLEALLESGKGKTPETTKVLAIFDNEETGSQTKQGAGSPFLSNILQRIVLSQGGTLDDYYRAVENAFMISADNAHAWHPNYAEKMDPTNHPKMGGGPVIKFNASQKYASDAVSAAIFANICDKAGVPCQKFVNHSDVAGGSTLGNILASSLPVKGVDMGNPIWGMHSVRETGNAADHIYCIKAFTTFYEM
ncbi:MAG: M18 family aminopeptidase [Bacteroidaceae bacterium]|nr:M18 family aminopeptidase [Bacteroidaceae bacterium]